MRLGVSFPLREQGLSHYDVPIMGTHIVRRAGIAALTIVVIGLAWGCESSGSTTPQAYFAATSPLSVIVTTDPPPGPHVVIAAVNAQTNDFSPISHGRLSRLLQREAGKLGADMVVNTRFELNYVANIGVATGTAIKITR